MVHNVTAAVEQKCFRLFVANHIDDTMVGIEDCVLDLSHDFNGKSVFLSRKQHYCLCDAGRVDPIFKPVLKFPNNVVIPSMRSNE